MRRTMTRGTNTSVLVCLVAVTSSVVASTFVAGKRQNDRGSEQLLFAGDKDVFGRTPECRACHAIINSLETTLVPAATVLRDRRRARAARGMPYDRPPHGEAHGLVDQYVPSACQHSAVWHSKRENKVCEKLLDKYEDDITQVYVRWTADTNKVRRATEKGSDNSAPGKPGEGTDEEEDDALNANWQVCWEATRACPKELARRPMSDFQIEQEAEDRTYRSEPTPVRSDGEGTLLNNGYRAVRKLTSGTFHDAVIGTRLGGDGRDVFVYFAFSKSYREIDEKLRPGYVVAAELFEKNGTAPATFMVIDVDANDMPPPHDKIESPTLACFPASAKYTPIFISNVLGGEMTPHDVLYFVMMVSTADIQTRRVASHLIFDHGDKKELNKKVWEGDEFDNDEL